MRLNTTGFIDYKCTHWRITEIANNLEIENHELLKSRRNIAL